MLMSEVGFKVGFTEVKEPTEPTYPPNNYCDYQKFPVNYSFKFCLRRTRESTVYTVLTCKGKNKLCYLFCSMSELGKTISSFFSGSSDDTTDATEKKPEGEDGATEEEAPAKEVGFIPKF